MSLHRFNFLGLTLGLLLAQGAQAHPYYPQGNLEPVPLPHSFGARMWSDWTSPLWPSESSPDRSFKSIWVRIFPLLSTPLGDPYPVTQDKSSLMLASKSGLRVYTLSTQRLLGEGKTVKFNFKNGTFSIDERSVSLEPLWIVPVQNALVQATWDKGQKLEDGRLAEVGLRLRGGFVVKKSLHEPRLFASAPAFDEQAEFPEANQELWSVINVLSVNDYLRSVVPSEVYQSWHSETLRAQAIAARTYALYELAAARARGQDFDVDPTTWYQSYRGVAYWDAPTKQWRRVELALTTSAVRYTRGKVILQNGEVIKAYFSANSGGRTCLATECLNLPQNPPYIHEINDHANIRHQPGGTWGHRADLTPKKIEEVLKGLNLAPAHAVQRLESLEKGPSGRTWRLRVILKDGSSLDLDRPQTRKIMRLFGPIRSYLYELLAVGADGRQGIRGHGYGHGVGMSQWGAQLYAKAGWSAEKILEHYYRNVTVKDLASYY